MSPPAELPPDIAAPTVGRAPRGWKVGERLAQFNARRGFGLDLADLGTPGLATDPAALQEVAQAYGMAAQLSDTPAPEAGVPDRRTPFFNVALLGPAWEPLGPAYMPNGQTYGSARVEVSGRVAAIAIDPSNSNHVLVGAAGGGIWQSTDGGATWSPRSDFAPTLAIGAVAFDPSGPATVYAGTGEGNFYGSLGAGVLRSTDGGSTWSVLATAPFQGQGFYRLLVDPGSRTHLFAATTAGLFRSVDSGATWTSMVASRCWEVSTHPGGGATGEVLAAASDGLHRSTNGGGTWTVQALPGAPASWTRLAVHHVRSDPRVAYVFGAANNAAFLWRRDTAGAWHAVTPPAALAVGQAWYDWYVTAATDSANQVYLGAIDIYRGDLSGTAWTWTDISSRSSGDSIHPDQHVLTIDPSNPAVLWAGSDGGVFRSPNRGANWTARNRGLAITEVEYLAHDWGSSHWLLAGTQDNGSIRWTGSPVWDHVADGDGGDCAVNRTSPGTCWHSFFNMGLQRSTAKADWGSWSNAGPSVPNGYSSLFYPPLEAHEMTLAQAGRSVWISRDGGTAWTEVTLAGAPTCSAMAIPTTNRVLVGTTGGQIFRIDWSGNAWGNATALTRPRSAWISDLWVDEANTNRIWATSSSIGGPRVWRSDDGGTTWTDRTGTLPALPINAIQVDPANPNRAWVSADVGVHQTTDGGATWSKFGRGLPNVLAQDLLYHPHARVLRVGTRNRGVWQVPVDGWMSTPALGTQFTGSLGPGASGRWFTFNWPATWHMVWTVMPTTVQSGAPQVTWKVQVERATAEYCTYWINVTNLTAKPISFEGRYAILSRY